MKHWFIRSWPYQEFDTSSFLDKFVFIQFGSVTKYKQPKPDFGYEFNSIYNRRSIYVFDGTVWFRSYLNWMVVFNLAASLQTLILISAAYARIWFSKNVPTKIGKSGFIHLRGDGNWNDAFNRSVRWTILKSFNCLFIFPTDNITRELLISHFGAILSIDRAKNHPKIPNSPTITKHSLSFRVITSRARIFFLSFFTLAPSEERIPTQLDAGEKTFMNVFVSNLKNGIFHCDIGC